MSEEQQKPTRFRRLLSLPQWAWAVSATSVKPESFTKPWYVRPALHTARLLRKLLRLGSKWWIPLCFLAGFVLSYALPQRHFGLDHFIRLTSSAAATQVLVVTTGSLAAILAIIFSVIFVSVEVFRKKPYRGRLSSILNSHPFRELLLFYVCTIISSVLVLASVKDDISIRNVHMVYFEIGMYVIALAALYPVVRRLLDLADPLLPVLKLLPSLNKNVAQLGRFAITHESEVAPAEMAHPLFALRDIALKTLADDNEIATIQIIYDTAHHLNEIVVAEKDGQERRMIINAFVLIWRSLMLRAIRLESEGVLLAIVDAVKVVNTDTSKRDFMWYELLELNDFHLELLTAAINAGFDEVAQRSIYLYLHIFEDNVPKNLPPASELSTFTDQKGKGWEHDADKELQWDHLTSGFISLIKRAADVAIQASSEGLVRASVSVFEKMLADVAKANLTDKQKGMLMAQISWNVKEIIVASLGKGFVAQLYLLLPGLDDYPNEDIAVSNREYSKYPFVFYKEMFGKAIEKSKLDSYTIDSARMLSYHLVDRLKQVQLERPRKLLFYVVDILSYVRTSTQSKMNEPNAKCYVAAYDAMTEIQKMTTELKDQELSIHIKKALGKFKNVESLRQTQNQYDDLW